MERCRRQDAHRQFISEVTTSFPTESGLLCSCGFGTTTQKLVSVSALLVSLDSKSMSFSNWFTVKSLK